MQTIHWLGAGLSTVPGIRRLANTEHALIVWNRTVEKAQIAIDGTTGADNGTACAMRLDLDELRAATNPGDVIVSMLPGDHHVAMAELALDNRAHFVSSSYISPEMRKLHSRVKEAELCNVNEVGLDPGIDHLFAHKLMHDYRASSQYRADNRLYFRSYCGGFPSRPNDFRYKFSWSPVGVLKALRSPAQWLENGEVCGTDTPWKAVTPYRAQLNNQQTEVFEAYPNRDSLPFMQDYGFDDDWSTHQFVRGTLRLDGWTTAWADIFNTIESLDASETGTQRLNALGDELWNKHQYDDGEPDRVVLCVELEVHDSDGKRCWHQSHNLDEIGNTTETAMARLVSETVAIAIVDVLAGKLPSGVTAACNDNAIVQDWLQRLTGIGVSVISVNHLSG